MSDNYEPLTEAELDAMQQWANDSPMNSRYNANFHRLLAEVRRLKRELEAQTAFSNVVTEQRDRKYAELERLGKLERTLWAENVKLKAELERLRAENVRLAAGWASVDTTKLADITDLEDCKRRLQRERERSHGAIRELCDLANTPAGAYKGRLDEANAELAKLRAVADAAEAYRKARLLHEDATWMGGDNVMTGRACNSYGKDLDVALAALGGTDA